MPKENSNTKNLFFKKSFATHLGGSSSSLDSQEARKTEEPNNNHEDNGDSEPGPAGKSEVDEDVVEDVVAPVEASVEDDVSVEDVPDSPQSKPGKRKSGPKSPPDRSKIKRSRSCSPHFQSPLTLSHSLSTASCSTKDSSPITTTPPHQSEQTCCKVVFKIKRARSCSPHLSPRSRSHSPIKPALLITAASKPTISRKPASVTPKKRKKPKSRSPRFTRHNSFISKDNASYLKPIRGKPRGPDDSVRAQGARTPRSPREQKLNRPNKDGGSGRKSYGRSGPLSSHQYRGPGHHHNRPHPVHAQPHYPGHPMAGMFPGPPVHAMHPQQYSEHLSQSPLESGFVMPIHASPRRTPRHSESDSCGSPVFPGGMPYQGHTQSPYASPPPTSPRNRMQDYYDSPPVQVPIMHHPRFHHHSPYDSPPAAPSPLNYASRGEVHAQGLVPQQRYNPQQLMQRMPSNMVPNPATMVPQNMVPQNMVQPEYLMQVPQQGQLRAQQPEATQQMLQQQMWQQMQHQMQQQRMQQSMLQQQQDQQQNQLQQNQMMAATPQMMAATPQMMAATQQNQMMAASSQQNQVAQQMMVQQQLAHMQTMFTPEQMQQMMLCMQQPQNMTQMLMAHQQKQLPQPQLQQVQPNILMNPQMAQAMPSQEMMQQFPGMAHLARPTVQPNMQGMQAGMQQFQNMQQQMTLMSLAGQQQVFAQGIRNPGFMPPRYPPPVPPSLSSTPDIPRTTPVPLEDPAIITTNPNDPSTVFGGPGSAFVDHSEQSKLPPHSIPVPKPDLPLRVSPHLAEPAEDETPVPKASTTDPMSNLTEQPKKNTPGIIHLPPAFPTEEEMMLSPDSTSGTPHSMKKNYWQMRQKSTEESPTTLMTKNIFPPEESPATALTKNLVAETKIREVAEKDEAETSSPAAQEEKPATAAPPETPKKSAQPLKGKEPKQFCLSDFSALVSDTVSHNSKLPKTTMPSGVGSVEVIPSESMLRSGRMSHPGNKDPPRDKHKETQWRAHDIREKDGADQWRPHSRESREREFEKLNSWRDAKPKDLSVDEDERRATLLKEAEAKGMSEGEQIAYALNKLKGASPQPKRPSESSVVDDDLLEGIPRWYDDDEDDELNPFDLNI